MRDLSTHHRTIRGKEIATLVELQLYAYEVPEHRSPPAILTRLTAGEEVDPKELYEALGTNGREVVGSSDAGLSVVETLRRRLETAFPEVLD